MNHVLRKIPPNKCTGCFLCHDICNKGAIKLSIDENGYYKPYVNENACVNCGLCSRKCPAINDQRPIESFKPLAFSAWRSNLEELKESSSGGIASILGELAIEKSWVVCGVKWKDGLPVYAIAETLEELKAFKGSKYLPPVATGIYNEVKKNIQAGRNVLFIGLPCHIRAIKNYIFSPNLTTVDILCAGTPSMLLYQEYCKWKFKDQKVTSVNFRSKENGWRNSTIKFYSDNKVLFAEENYKNRFFLGFNSTLFYNEACYGCRFNTIPRIGDLTLGDFWGASKEVDNHNGNSIVLVNTAKGMEIVKMLSPKHVCLNEIKVDKLISLNYRIDQDYREMPKERKDALLMLGEKGFKKCSDKYFRPANFFEKLVAKIKRCI